MYTEDLKEFPLKREKHQPGVVLSDFVGAPQNINQTHPAVVDSPLSVAQREKCTGLLVTLFFHKFISLNNYPQNLSLLIRFPLPEKPYKLNSQVSVRKSCSITL